MLRRQTHVLSQSTTPFACTLGKLAAADPRICSKGHAREVGHHQHPRLENQESQYMLDLPNPRGSFSELHPDHRGPSLHIYTCKTVATRTLSAAAPPLITTTPNLLSQHTICFLADINYSERTRSTTTRDRNLQFRGFSPLEFGRFSPVFLQCISSSELFPFSPGFLCNLVRKSPQNVERIARFPGGVKVAESCHVSSCHDFVGPEFTPRFSIITSIFYFFGINSN